MCYSEFSPTSEYYCYKNKKTGESFRGFPVVYNMMFEDGDENVENAGWCPELDEENGEECWKIQSLILYCYHSEIKQEYDSLPENKKGELYRFAWYKADVIERCPEEWKFNPDDWEEVIE